MIELKPCPFCGGDALIWATNDEYPYMVKCMNKTCACRTDMWRNVENAIKSWNKRTNQIDEYEVYG